MTDEAVRIGFIGCGRQASAAWYPNFATIPELELQACCDLIVDLAERNARYFGARRWYTDLDEMLRREELDAVMVVGPPEMHYSCGRQVLEAGLSLMMEKPLLPGTPTRPLCGMPIGPCRFARPFWTVSSDVRRFNSTWVDLCDSYGNAQFRG
jgi:hypothetical protein